jgi:hypothetical protein
MLWQESVARQSGFVNTIQNEMMVVVMAPE